MKKILTISATALAAAIALAGCSAGSGGSMPGMNMGGSGTSTDSAPIAIGDHNGADTTFAQMMIPHHTQAVEMSDLILKKQGIDPKVTALAVKIKAEQAPEITTMSGWLQAWNEPSQMSGGGMSGAMSSDDMTKLDAAQGAEAAKLYLSQMITHHQGAVTMAKTEEATGKNTDTVTLSKNIVTSQEAEIQEMKNLLATL
ncbi:DUF305 domain-containing protein [Arthrobacter sp. H16F315]|uniref:DUF305 domain-containing protein n=1 Tax=Arthrobacter sp. H16F315 TaxID=2955314 RepID=UPI0020983AB3|nr:DUF305 domain-containing protein [Arthrobacter sp. H16F315]MDD1478587.1 DUF305 domain-containing protein [Arthrobacter sp. H16F315]